MKLVSFCSFKGGAGKTTALMAVCSSLVAQGHKIALFEADDNSPLTKWRDNALSLNCWDDLCAVFLTDEIASLEKAYMEASDQGYTLALVDTRGGGSELNNTIIASSDFLVVPSMLTPLDIDEALSTYSYIVELLLAEKLGTPSGVLKQRVPLSRLTVSQKNAIRILNSLPSFDVNMHDRDAFSTIKTKGMLHRVIGQMEQNPMARLQLRNFKNALQEADKVTKYILNGLNI